MPPHPDDRTRPGIYECRRCGGFEWFGTGSLLRQLPQCPECGDQDMQLRRHTGRVVAFLGPVRRMSTAASKAVETEVAQHGAGIFLVRGDGSMDAAVLKSCRTLRLPLLTVPKPARWAAQLRAAWMSTLFHVTKVVVFPLDEDDAEGRMILSRMRAEDIPVRYVGWTEADYLDVSDPSLDPTTGIGKKRARNQMLRERRKARKASRDRSIPQAD